MAEFMNAQAEASATGGLPRSRNRNSAHPVFLQLDGYLGPAHGFLAANLKSDYTFSKLTSTEAKGNPMRFNRGLIIAVAFALLIPSAFRAKAQDDASRLVGSGGISVPGWMGKVDPGAERSGQSIKDAKLAPEGKSLHVTTGPNVVYWNPANKATGDYKVTATFTESKFMNLNSHPHPYGLLIGGNDMGTPNQSYLYCAAYGNGTFIVRGFGPEPFQMNGRGGENAAIHQAAGPGMPVTQEISMSVKGNRVDARSMARSSPHTINPKW